MRAARHIRGQQGLSLIELMVSMVIASIGIAAALAMGTTMVQGMNTHRRMVNVERSARISMEIITNTIRNSSPGVTTNQLTDLVGCSNFGGTGSALNVVNSATGPDTLEVIYASGGVVGGLAVTYDSTSTQVRAVKGVSYSTIDQVQVGDMVVITDGATGHLVEVTSVSDGGVTWDLGTVAPASSGCVPNNMPPAGYKPGALVVRAKIARFSIMLLGNTPTLMMDPDGNGPAAAEPLAEGIEDMQVAVGVDANGDGAVTDANSATDEWHYNSSGDALPAGTPRAYRLSLVARSVGETDSRTMSIRPSVEDHTGASTADPFRRRILSTTVEIRNLEGSP